MTCRDCIHERVCLALIEKGLPWVDGEYPAEAFCMTFKNKADFVEVVMCKDCDIPHNKWTGCPKLNGLILPPNFFCGYGERRKK